MHHLLSWTNGTAKAFASLAVVGAALKENALAVGAAIVAVLVTVTPYAIKAYHDYRQAKRREDAADTREREFEDGLRERIRLEERCRILEERVKELEACKYPRGEADE